MDFQALERKRRNQLSQLTKFKNQLKFNNDVTEILLQRHLNDLEAIKIKHEEITDLMLENAECTDDMALKLEDDIGRFYDSVKEAYLKLDEFKDYLKPQDLETTVRDNTQNLLNGNSLSQAKIYYKMKLRQFSNMVSMSGTQSFAFEFLESLLIEANALSKHVIEGFDAIYFAANENEQNEMDEEQKIHDATFYKFMNWIQNEKAKKKEKQVVNKREMHAKIKLPTIDLPKFDGSPESWISFRDTFKSMIHANNELSGCSKFRYLKTAITDKLSPIGHLLESDEGYEDAWEAVITCYDDKRKILDKHFSSLLKSMTSESAGEIQKILNDVTMN